MIFEEKEDISLDANKNWMIYFLIKNNEVVYVGQTTQNLIRPFSHKDKDFDTVKIIYQAEDKELLNKNEEFYIKKYSPKYNKTFNSNGYSDSLINHMFEVEKIKYLTQYYMTREQINDELLKYKVQPLTKKEFKKLYKSGFYLYDKQYLMDPDSLMKLITQRIHPENTKIAITSNIKKTKKNNFADTVNELLKQFEIPK